MPYKFEVLLKVLQTAVRIRFHLIGHCEEVHRLPDDVQIVGHLEDFRLED